MMHYFFNGGALAFGMSLLSVYLIRKLAYAKQWVATPSKDRWHKKTTALHGGVGIFIAFFITSLIVYSTVPYLSVQLLFLSLIVGSTISFLVGFLDDVYHLTPTTKILGQLFAASIFIMYGERFSIFDFELYNILFTFFWFVAVMNAVNLLDNMDGLAAGIVLISSLTLLALLLIAGHSLHSFYPLIICQFLGAVAGFFIFNHYPASIFMGDGGSLFLGYLLAALAIPPMHHGGIGAHYSPLLILLVPVTILAIPVFDTTMVTIARTFSGRSVTQGGSDHSSHRLVGLGFSEKQSVYILYCLSLFGSITAIGMALFYNLSMFVFGIYLVFMLLVGTYLGRRKIYTQEEASARHSGWTPLISQIMYKKGIMEIVLDMILIALAYFFVWYTYGGLAGISYNDPLDHTIVIVVIMTIVFFRLAGMYKGVWHLISLEDLTIFIRAIGLATMSLPLLHWVWLNHWLHWFFYIYYGLMLLCLVIGSRLSFRYLDTLISMYSLSQRKFPIIIYGAGAAGKLVVEEIRRNPLYQDIRPVGFVDDEKSKHGRYVSGIKILGGLNDVIALLKQGKVPCKEFWLSTESISDEAIAQLESSFSEDIKLKKMGFKIAPVEID